MRNNFVPIIKTVGFACNCDCRYCYYHEEDKTLDVMPDNVLEALVRETCRHNPNKAQFYWHGGEPLLAGIDFYRKALELEEKYRAEKQELENLVQTNATLFDREWASFFKRNEFEISISLDGPKEFHDLYRCFRGDTGTFNRVMQAVTLLKENSLDFGVVCVVTKESVDCPERLFEFFSENKICNVSFIRAEGRDATGNLLPYAPEPEKFGGFLVRMFDLWVERDDPSMKWAPFDNMIYTLINGESLNCIFAAECEKFLVVKPNGDLYACNSEGMGKRWKLGQIKNLDLNSSEFELYRAKSRSVREQCLGCKWGKICRGGCLYDYELDYPFLGEKNVLCESLKTLFQHIYDTLVSYDLIAQPGEPQTGRPVRLLSLHP